jgi:hypothetical protein
MGEEENPMDFSEGEDIIDEAEDDFEDGKELQEAQLESFAGAYPESKEGQNIYNWFWKVVKLRKPFSLVKVANLNNEEIGKSKISNREALNLWVLGNTFHHAKFGNYFATIAKINSATSMARKGWFMDLSISQKRVRERTKNPLEKGEQPWRVFKKKGQPLPED